MYRSGDPAGRWIFTIRRFQVRHFQFLWSSAYIWRIFTLDTAIFPAVFSLACCRFGDIFNPAYTFLHPFQKPFKEVWKWRARIYWLFGSNLFFLVNDLCSAWTNSADRDLGCYLSHERIHFLPEKPEAIILVSVLVCCWLAAVWYLLTIYACPYYIVWTQ